MSRVQVQALLDAYTRHVNMRVRAGGEVQPKHHLMLHLVQRCLRFGNPKYYWTYRDESSNGIVTKIARSCYRRRFMMAVHDKFKWLTALDLCTQMF